MNLFQKYLVDEFVEDYQEQRISRREALKLIGSVVGSLALASSILAACAPLEPEEAALAPAEMTPAASATSLAAMEHTPVPAAATATSAPQRTAETPATGEAASTLPAGATEPVGAPHGTVTANDPLIIASGVNFPAPNAELMGYLARPVTGDGAPVILVCHENRGLTAHIQDVARRLAKAGYVALAVDLLSRQGGSAALDSSEVPGLLGNIEPDTFVEDFMAGWRWLGDQPFALTERVGMVGFCFGGGVTWRVATQMAELKAAAPFYGPHPELNAVPNIQAAVQAVYGELDGRINAGIPAIESAMRENGKIYKKLIYPGADHAFFNDTGTRYNPAAAEDAWRQTLLWFATYV